MKGFTIKIPPGEEGRGSRSKTNHINGDDRVRTLAPDDTIEITADGIVGYAAVLIHADMLYAGSWNDGVVSVCAAREAK